eukprot:Lankesteria_metandrocarpae@DN3725_c0_g1_i3.p1
MLLNDIPSPKPLHNEQVPSIDTTRSNECGSESSAFETDDIQLFDKDLLKATCAYFFKMMNVLDAVKVEGENRIKEASRQLTTLKSEGKVLLRSVFTHLQSIEEADSDYDLEASRARITAALSQYSTLKRHAFRTAIGPTSNDNLAADGRSDVPVRPPTATNALNLLHY